MSKRTKHTVYTTEINNLLEDALETQEGIEALMTVLTKALASIIMNADIEKDKNIRKTLINNTGSAIRAYVKMMEVQEKEHTTFKA